MQQRQARAVGQHGRHDMGGAAVASRGIAELAGVFFGQLHELFQVSGGEVRPNHQDIGRAGDQGHSRQIAACVIGHLRHQCGNNGVCANGHHQGMAIRCCLGHLGRAHGAHRARAIFNHDGLSKFFLQVQRHHARHHVHRAPRGKGHHQANGLGGVSHLLCQGTTHRTDTQTQHQRETLEHINSWV